MEAFVPFLMRFGFNSGGARFFPFEGGFGETLVRIPLSGVFLFDGVFFFFGGGRVSLDFFKKKATGYRVFLGRC